MKSNERNIIWNPKSESINYGFSEIVTPDEIGIIQGKDGVLKTINREEEKRKLYNGEACFHTDAFYSYPKWFDSQIYGRNYIRIPLRHNFNDGSRNFATLGEMLKKIKKLEHLFPENTELGIDSQFYGEKEGRTYSMGLKYVTKRKFKGFNTKFQVSKSKYYDNFEKDELKAKLITFLRQNGFLAQVWNEEYDYDDDEVKGCKLSLIYGHGLMIGLSEFNNRFNGYWTGMESILYDKLGEFDKWSKAFQIPKPTSEKDFDNILQTLIDHGKEQL